MVFRMAEEMAGVQFEAGGQVGVRFGFGVEFCFGSGRSLRPAFCGIGVENRRGRPRSTADNGWRPFRTERDRHACRSCIVLEIHR